MNRQVVIEVPKKIKEDTGQKNYATVSLFCLTVTNPFRDKVIRLVLNMYTHLPTLYLRFRWFDRLILIVIVSNCVLLAMDDPNVAQFPYQYRSDIVFQCIYTMEMLLKIIAFGFLFKPYSYLRDPWNIVSSFHQITFNTARLHSCYYGVG